MERTQISQIKAGTSVKVQGFVENIRDGKNMAFMVVKDITGKLQVTIEKKKCQRLQKKYQRFHQIQ